MGKITDKIKHAAAELHRCWRVLQVFIERGAPTSPVSTEETECRHCGYVFCGNYCPRCGQNRAAGKGKPRFLKTFREAYPQLSNNFLRTIVHLLLRPGYMMRDYFRGHRVIYQSPVSTFLIALSIVAICMGIGHRIAPTYFEEVKKNSGFSALLCLPMEMVEQYAQKSPTMKNDYARWRAKHDKTPTSRKGLVWGVVKEKLTSNVSLTLFVLFPLLGVTSYFLFRRRKFDGRRLTIMEHYIIFVYLFAIAYFFDFVDTNGFITLFYLVWSYRGLYRLSWWKAFGYAFAVSVIDLMVLLLLLMGLFAYLMVQMILA